MKKLSNADAELKKSVEYKNSVYLVLRYLMESHVLYH